MTQVPAGRTQVQQFLMRCSPRADPSELEQGFIRLVFAAILLACFLGYSLSDGQIDVLEQRVLIGTLLYFAVSIALLATMIWAGGVSVVRRYAGMLLDIVAISAFMLTMGEAGGVMCVLYLYVIFGNGFRYGRTYLHVCQALALIGLSTVLLVEPHWSNSLSVGFAWLFAIVILPFYVGVLAQRIIDARKRADEASETKPRLLEYVSRQIGKPLDTIVAEYNASFSQETQ